MHEVAQWDSKGIELGTGSLGFQPCLDTDDSVT